MQNAVTNFWKRYSKETHIKIKLIDTFMLFLVSVIVWVMFYRVVVGNDFPKNAFLSSIFTPLGVIAMTIALRIHICNDEGVLISSKEHYRPLWEYMAGLLVLFVVAINFLG